MNVSFAYLLAVTNSEIQNVAQILEIAGGVLVVVAIIGALVAKSKKDKGKK